jgi:SAM-dependent MidA family methyltransferase
LLAAFPQMVWFDGFSRQFEGVVFGNEVLDACPST